MRMDTVTLVIILIILVLVVAFLAMAIRIANQWERAVVLFLGKFVGIQGPGLFIIIPILNRIPYMIDLRVITTSFTAE
jgi:regulator of protease activity HflC (stomatin/prohibitin superfamily)